MKRILLIFAFVLIIGGCSNFINTKTEMIENNITNPQGQTMIERINTPDGFKRTEGSGLAEFLRNYNLKSSDLPLLLYNGEEKGNQSSHCAIFSLPLEDYDLQQCADSVMRVYAEYYWNSGQADKIAFHLTDGFLLEYTKWRDGYRVSITESGTKWVKTSEYDDSYENFVKYLKIVFAYAGTASMQSYESETITLEELDIGDVLLKGGSPGHVVMIVDKCENEEGKRAFLLAQGYMPAQEFHIITNPYHNDNPWYYDEEMTFPLRTSGYTFDSENMIKRLKY